MKIENNQELDADYSYNSYNDGRHSGCNYHSKDSIWTTRVFSENLASSHYGSKAEVLLNQWFSNH